MLDHSRIRDRLAEIRKRLRELKTSIKTVDKERFLTDSLLADASERRLEVAIQACLDIAGHIVSQAAVKKPKKENKELFLILTELGIIEDRLAKKLVKMAGMRNILVHEYLEIAREKVYQAVKEDLGDILQFCQEIEEFLEKRQKRAS